MLARVSSVYAPWIISHLDLLQFRYTPFSAEKTHIHGVRFVGKEAQDPAKAFVFAIRLFQTTVEEDNCCLAI